MTLGNVGRASVDQFAGARKLLLVPLMTSISSEPILEELLGQYWSEVGEQVRRLERRLGSVTYVLHEGSVDRGEATLASLEKANPTLVALVRELWLRGAQLEPIEDVEVLLETLDLHRCLLLGMASATVARQLVEWYADARKRRFAFMAKRIDETIGQDKVGLLIIGQDHQLQFPPDMEVVYVAPPTLNKIQQWLRDHQKANGERTEKTPEGEPAGDDPAGGDVGV